MSQELAIRIATDLGYLKYDASHIVAKDKIKDLVPLVARLCRPFPPLEP